MNKPALFTISPQPASAGVLTDVPASGLRTGMANAFLHGAAKAVALNTAAGGPADSSIKEAFAILDRVDVVVGPTGQGGIYLLGIRGSQDALMQALNWASVPTLEQIMTQCQRLALSFWLMETRTDAVGGRKAGSVA